MRIDLVFRRKSDGDASALVALTSTRSGCRSGGCGEKLKGFFTKLGAPRTRVRGEKPHEFFNKQRVDAGSAGRPKWQRPTRSGERLTTNTSTTCRRPVFLTMCLDRSLHEFQP